MSKVSKEKVNELVKSISTYIPKNKMSEVWQTYKDISGSKEPQPCSCPSSGKLWRKAMDTIREYAEREE